MSAFLTRPAHDASPFLTHAGLAPGTLKQIVEFFGAAARRLIAGPGLSRALDLCRYSRRRGSAINEVIRDRERELSVCNSRDSFYLCIWEIPSNEHKSIPADVPNINHKARQGATRTFSHGERLILQISKTNTRARARASFSGS